MPATIYAHQQYSVGFMATVGIPCYGRVVRGDKVFYRNYKRPVKGGITSLEVMLERKKEVEKMMRNMCGVTPLMVGSE